MQYTFLVSSVVLVVVVLTPTIITGKIYDKCSLAVEMDRLGVSRSELPDWVCTARYESKYNTSAVGPPNKNKTRDWGIFQINDKWWCKSPARPSHNQCNVNCEDLLTDDITKSVKCARLIKRRQGFTAWVAWKKWCQTNKPSVDECFNN